MAVAVALVLPTFAVPHARLAAQTADPSGTWNVRWAQAVRVNRDGTIEVQGWGDAVLTLEVVDGSVTGRWTTNVREEVNWTLSGTFEGATLRLVATEHDSTNEELAIVERLEFEIRVAGAEMEGWVALTFRGMARDPGRRPLSGTRARD